MLVVQTVQMLGGGDDICADAVGAVQTLFGGQDVGGCRPCRCWAGQMIFVQTVLVLCKPCLEVKMLGVQTILAQTVSVQALSGGVISILVMQTLYVELARTLYVHRI